MSKRIIFIVLIFSVILTACSSSISEPITKTRLIMGTIVDISIYENVKEEIFKDAFDRLKDIENKMSINLNTSEIMNVNNNSGKKEVPVSSDTFYVVEKGLDYSNLSNGRFDITIGPLVKIWGIGTDNAKVPKDEDINNTLNLINYNNVALNKKNKGIFLKKENMIVDLGAIAKGYAADEVYHLLKKKGIKHAIINIGGNVFTLGNNPKGMPWQIGIQDPLSPRGNYVGIVKGSDMSVVSSGIYERFIEFNGKQYHHILDTKSGYPVENNLMSVTIVNKSSIDGDGLSTTAFALGLEEGLKLIESLKNTEAIFITKDKKIYLTSGMKEIFKLTNDKYTIVK